MFGKREYLVAAGERVEVGVPRNLGGMRGVNVPGSVFESSSSPALVFGRLSSKDRKLSKVLLLLASSDEDRVAAGRLRNMTLYRSSGGPGISISSFGTGGLVYVSLHILASVAVEGRENISSSGF